MSVTQKDRRSGVEVDRSIQSVSSVRALYTNGVFKNRDQAIGAFLMAYQQGLDGMGSSIESWMGLSAEEYARWMTSNHLPGSIRKNRHQLLSKTDVENAKALISRFRKDAIRHLQDGMPSHARSSLDEADSLERELIAAETGE